jgi:hypothetical protein
MVENRRNRTERPGHDQRTGASDRYGAVVRSFGVLAWAYGGIAAAPAPSSVGATIPPSLPVPLYSRRERANRR